MKSLTLAVLVVFGHSASAQANRDIDVRSYVVRVAPDLATRTVAGSVAITFVAATPLTHVSFDAGSLTVDAATVISHEHRFGRDAYDELIAGYRSDYDRLREAGRDKPLVFADWSHPTADDRTLVYRKGAYVLAVLRETIGDQAFWAGLRAYTRQFDGKSVSTDDLRAQMQRVSGQNLGGFFSRWASLR